MSNVNHKKRKRQQPAIDTSKPTATFKPGSRPGYSISVALPGSIIANAQTHDQRTALAGQIGRALAVFCVDEVIIFDDGQGSAQSRNHWTGEGGYSARQHRQKSGMNGSHHHQNGHYDGSNSKHIDNSGEDDSAYTGTSNPSRFLARLLSFLETPPHLRRVLFPLHPDLRNAGTLPSLAMPHHLKADEWCPYREGVVVSGPAEGNGVTAGSKTAADIRDENYQMDQEDANVNFDLASNNGTKKRRKEKMSKKANKTKPEPSEETLTSSVPHLVNVGYPNPITVRLPTSVPPSTRLTLHLTDPPRDFNPSHAQILTNITAVPVPPTGPRNAAGYYWGYAVRQAPSLSAIFTECPYAGGYDVSFGTSERGMPLSSLVSSINLNPGSNPDPNSKNSPAGIITDISPLRSPFRHVLLVFGGVAGLEKALESDEVLSGGTGVLNEDESGGRHGNRSDQRTTSPVIKDVSQLFDFWINLVPGQGSRTIRTEEAVWLGLMGFNNLMDRISEMRRGKKTGGRGE